MPGTLVDCRGFDVHTTVWGLSTFFTRDTTTVDTGSTGSMKCNQTVLSRDYRYGVGGSNYGCWFNLEGTPAVGTAFSLAAFNFTAGAGTAQNYVICIRNDLKVEAYDAGTSLTTQGTATGTVSASALSTGTGYWLWWDVEWTIGGASTIKLYVDFTLFYTFSFTSTSGAGAAQADNLWGPAGATASGVAGYADNLIGIDGPLNRNDGERRGWRAYIKRATVSGAGTDNGFNLVGAATRYEAVDEEPANGDTDYVWIDSTSAANQTFAMTNPGEPAGYLPVRVAQCLSARNADAGKWAAIHAGRAYFNGTVRGASVLTDPGGTYTNFTDTLKYSSGVVTGRLLPSDLAAWEAGFSLSADASEAADWRISAVQAEVLYLPSRSLPPTRPQPSRLLSVR